MSAGKTWADSVAEELDPLLDQAEGSGVEALDEDDAARALVLLARAEQLGGDTAQSFARGVAHLPALSARAPLVAPARLLGVLDDRLDDGEDPHGPLQDSLLDLDDWLSVAELLDRRGVRSTAPIDEAARAQVSALAAARIALSPEAASALAPFALARISGLQGNEGGAWDAVAGIWRAVADAALQVIAERVPVLATAPAPARIEAAVSDLLERFPSAPRVGLGDRVRRLAEAISIGVVAPLQIAYASAGVDLGPDPGVIGEVGGARLELAIAADLISPILQVSGPGAGAPPSGTRDGIPLTFAFDEFGAWIAEAKPGVHRVTVDGDTLEFDLAGG